MPIMKHLMPMLFGLICSVAVSHGQPNVHSTLAVAGDRSASVQWTLGEVFSGLRPDATGSSLTAGFIQPMVAMATDLRPDIQQAGVSAFPIPARHYLTIRFDQISDWTLYLFDVRGTLLSTRTVAGQQTRVPLSALHPGVYVLRVLDTDQRSRMIRFIKH